MKRFLVVVLIFINPISSFSQKEGANWVFGDSAGISFVNGFPQNFTSNLNSIETSACISDSLGNLLFYCGSLSDSLLNGFFEISVFQNNFLMMPNGNGLNGYSSCTQGSLIVPNLVSPSKFYIFHCGLYLGIGIKLNYSEVDMSLNSGFGDIITKNNILSDSLITEKLQSVKHANGRDWWIVTHSNKSNIFYKALLTPQGIVNFSWQAIGNSIDSMFSNDIGQMIFSQNGDKLAYGSIAGQLDVFDFDRCTGILSNFISLGEPPYTQITRYYGCSFSPDGNILYASTFDSLFQYNLTAPNIYTTKRFMFTVNDSSYQIGQHLLGPDGKTFITNVNVNNMGYVKDSITTTLNVIFLPNNYGSSCLFLPYSFSLGNQIAYYNLPNMPNYNLGRLIGSPCDTLTNITNNNINEEIIFNVTPNPFTNEITVTSNKQKIEELILMNILGGKMVERNTINSTSYSFKSNAVSNGIYFLHIKTKEGVFVKKVIRQVN